MIKLTGIGSTPFMNFDRAIEFSKSHDLVFFPEPKNYFLYPNLQYVRYFLEQTKNISEIKIQLIGPMTFIRQNKKDFYEYKNMLYALLELLKKEQRKIYLQLDEPILPVSDIEKKWLKDSLNDIENEKIIPLLHSCAKISDVSFFDFLTSGNLAIDLILNQIFQTNEKLLVSGIDPYKTNLNIESEFYSFTCGYGTMSEKECLNIFKKLSEIKFLYR